MGTAGTPPDCAQCETGYVPPRRAHALPVAQDRACLASVAHDVALVGLQRVCWCRTYSNVEGLPHCLFVCWRRTYSDVEGLPQCVRCPGDKNYTLVKVATCALLSAFASEQCAPRLGLAKIRYVSATKPTPKSKH
jgi:hypothetical protein